MKSNGVANPGFYDQRMAFEWVQEYIYAFGGNPKDVTGMGLSSGGSLPLIPNRCIWRDCRSPFSKSDMSITGVESA